MLAPWRDTSRSKRRTGHGTTWVTNGRHGRGLWRLLLAALVCAPSCRATDAPAPLVDKQPAGAPASAPAGRKSFTIIALPDTQFYAESHPRTLFAQLQWIRENRLTRNIAFVTHLGDCVEAGDSLAQWSMVDAAYRLIEHPGLTGLATGIPYGIGVGNHDQIPEGSARTISDENVSSLIYNRTFPKSRFAGRPYHGDNFPLPGYPESMDNHYELFSAAGMDFIVFHLEFDPDCSWPEDGSPPRPRTTCQHVLAWMRHTLAGEHKHRRAIIVSHFVGTPTPQGEGEPGFSAQGQAIFNAVKRLPNVFLVLGAHLDQADHRTDKAADGHAIHTVISDYQTLPDGGNGWLRIMTFDPDKGKIHIETWSPRLGRFIGRQADGTPFPDPDDLAPGENEITLDYPMASRDGLLAAGAP